MDGGTNKSARKQQQQSGITSFFRKKAEPEDTMKDSEKLLAGLPKEGHETHLQAPNSPTKEQRSSPQRRDVSLPHLLLSVFLALKPRRLSFEAPGGD